MEKQVKGEVRELSLREKLIASNDQLLEVIGKLIGCKVHVQIEPKMNHFNKEIFYVTSKPVDERDLGIARFMFKSLTLHSFNKIWMKEAGDGKKEAFDPWFTLHASYEHQSGGSNGCTFGIGGKTINLVFNPKTSSWNVQL